MNQSSTPPFSQSRLAISNNNTFPQICGRGRLSRMSFPQEAVVVFGSEEPPFLFTKGLDAVMKEERSKHEIYLLNSTSTVSKVFERRQLPRQFNLVGST
jgi:hypothetical protein